MSARVIPDFAAVGNHFSASFSPHVTEANATEISGLKDETEVIDGPDGRGYATGKASKQELTVVVPCHDPANPQFHAWKDKCENGALGHAVAGVVTLMTAGDVPVQVWELTNCICRAVEGTSMKLDGAEVGADKFMISYARAKVVGP